MEPVYILAGARTPFAVWARGRCGDGSRGGAYKDVDIHDLGARALKGALERSGADPGAVRRVVFGNIYEYAPHACLGARYTALRAGVAVESVTPSVTIGCGTGLYALASAAHEVRSGVSLAAAGGADIISQARKESFYPSFKDMFCDLHVGATVDRLARRYGLKREECDAWALRSHTLAAKARREGRIAGEIVPVEGILDKDDGLIEEPALSHFQAAKPVCEGGLITKATTHGLADGASALVLADEEGAKAAKSEPLGRLVASDYVGVEPIEMGYATVPAIRGALEKAGLTVEDVDLFELNETFAAQILIVMRELGIPEAKLNVNGGTIAIGHPFAATGCKLVLGLLLELKRRKLKYGVVAICVGGGQGFAVVVEAL